ncbi:MAG: hypothetical protein ABWY06_11600 [Pseudomonas sp.]|uniref:hypothetical protein n=1 Tax=Pseudomonas sp. TaxID=306 RepID=UPI003396DF88
MPSIHPSLAGGLLALSMLFTPLFALATDLVYPVGQVSDNDPGLVLKRVRQSADSTQLFLEYNERESSARIGTYPPGHPDSFRLIDPASGREYALRAVKGIATAPDFDETEDGDSLEFSLEFEPVAVRRFDLREGMQKGEEDEVMWHISGIRLQP